VKSAGCRKVASLIEEGAPGSHYSAVGVSVPIWFPVLDDYVGSPYRKIENGEVVPLMILVYCRDRESGRCDIEIKRQLPR
jgi:hypothetical protein